ncbi:secreted protein containing Conserved hypothetical protein CHP02597 [Candidatus Magnetomorum sp. HK-1]|nr:secreted protein containing Conserved hypothetical protein CHP02597 [Candidatus Magnetomorum sp. HK-1]
MKATLTIITIILLFLSTFAYSENLYTAKTAGLQSQYVVKEGKKYNIISIPFIKPSVINGDIEAVDHTNKCLVDDDKSFTSLPPENDYIIRLTSGEMKGTWYLISTKKRRKSMSASPNSITVDLSKSSKPDLTGISEKDTYSIHPLYDLAELFPEDGSILPAANFDYDSGRIQFISNSQKTTLWLSNGKMTDQKGWMKMSGNNVNLKVDHFSILPGMAMIVFHPKPEKSIYISIPGQVLDSPLAKPIYPGENLVSIEYLLLPSELSGQISYSLDELKLIESGFQSGRTIDESDTLKIWDDMTSKYSGNIWLFKNDAGNVEWLTENYLPVSNMEVRAGSGMVICNKGIRYSWIK